MASVKIAAVTPEAKGSFAAAFVLPITRDGRALLTKEKRGSKVKYGMLGGKALPEETDFQCMSREAKEESGGALSFITLARISEGRGIIDGVKVYYENSKSYAVQHDLVVSSDLDVATRFEPAKAAMRTSRAVIKKKKKGAAKRSTEQVGLEFVPMESLRNSEWRGKNMHHVASVLAARLLKM